MRRTIIILMLSALFSANISAEQIKAFGVGEKLYYRMHWKNITAAYSMAEVLSRQNTAGKDSFHFRAKMTSNNTLVDKFFKVRDKIDCWWDISTRQPLHSKYNIHEGYYFRKLDVHYKVASNKAFYDMREYKGNTNSRGVRNKNARWEHKKGSYDIPSDFQDIVSSFYSMRANPKKGKPGTKFSLKVFTDTKMNVLDVTILKKERVKVAAGTFDTIKVKPFIHGNHFFESYGEVYVWISDDQYRYPVKVAAKVPVVGFIQGELVKIVKGKE